MSKQQNFVLKKEKIDPSKFVYTFEITHTTDRHTDTYLLHGSEETVRENFEQLIDLEKKRFKNAIKFRNDLVDKKNKDSHLR